jgi:hypothetical protein
MIRHDTPCNQVVVIAVASFPAVDDGRRGSVESKRAATQSAIEEGLNLREGKTHHTFFEIFVRDSLDDEPRALRCNLAPQLLLDSNRE